MASYLVHDVDYGDDAGVRDLGSVSSGFSGMRQETIPTVDPDHQEGDQTIGSRGLRENRTTRSKQPGPAHTGGVTQQMSGRQSPRDHVAVLHKALDLLQSLAGAPLSPAEISKQIGMAKPTVYRIIRTLESRGFVAREQDASRYMLGTAVYALGSKQRSDILSLARPYMVRLAAEFGETVNLAIPVHNEVVYIDVLESMHQLRTQVPAGFRDHLHSTALGKAVLAALPDEEIRAILTSTERPVKTPKTVVAVSALMRQVREIRDLGYAVDDEENELGSVCVATAFVDHSGRPVGAISVTGPRWRISDQLVEVIGAELAKSTTSVSATLRSRNGSLADTSLVDLVLGPG